jgi:hypothetical protein
VSDDLFKEMEETAKQPANTVQLSAAIVAYAGIVLYPFIKRDDCYYTDTDSIVVQNEFSEEMVWPFCENKHAPFTIYALVSFSFGFIRAGFFTPEERAVVLLFGICPAARSPHASSVLVQLV